MKLTILLNSILPFLVIACDSTGTDSSINIPDTTNITFESVKDYGFFAVADKGTIIINTESEWLIFWNLYWNLFDGSGNKILPPPINFEEKMVIGVFWGGSCKYSGCFSESPSIQSINRIGDTLFVSVGDLVDFGLCEMCIAPIHMVQLESLSFPIKFIGNVP